jgi:hypothetical protein
MLEGEYIILKRYENGEDVIPEHLPLLEEYASIGVVKRIGFSFDRECQTAILSDSGKHLIKREEIKRSPVKRFFYSWANNLF